MPPLRNTGSAPEAEHPDYAGRYLLESVLGSGGMGVVHLATSASGLRLAVKVIHTRHASDPEFRARFRQEIAAARRVSGAFTAPVVDADPDAERPWMATLFIDGPTLSERVRRSGRLSAGDLIKLGAGLAEGLRDIHRAGVVHRDLKPSNVLLASDGPKVIDFGISRPADSDLRTETGKLIGTPPFMAPEQFQRPREVGPAADVFAMGAVLVHAATGRGPFDSDSPYIVAYQVVHNEPDLAGVPERLLPLITRCLAKEPGDRPTPDEFMTALRASSSSYRSPSDGADDAGDADDADADGPAGSDRRARTYDLRGAYGASPLVPAQRGPTPAETSEGDGTGGGAAPTTHHSRARGSETVPSSPPLQSSPPSVSLSLSLSRKGARRALRTAATGVALAVVAGAGFLGIRAVVATDDDGATRPRTADTDQTFRPWRTVLSTGADESRTPVCTADGVAVYCTAPGVKATRIDGADGRVDWSVRAAKGAHGTAESGSKDTDTTDAENTDAGAPPVISGGLLQIISPAGNHLEALDPATGAKRWDVDISTYAAVRHLGGSVLLVAYDGRVRALDSATGAERWSKRHGGTGTVWAAASGGDGPLFAATPSADGTVTEVSSVDPRTGDLRWEKRLKGGLTPAGVSDGALFLLSGNTDGYTDAVVRLDATSRSVGRVPLTAPVDQAQATVAGDTVYVIGYTGSLLAVDTVGSGNGTRNGKVRWRLETSVTRASRPAATGDRVYLSTGDGRLLAVGAARGVLLGQTKPRMADGPHTLVPSLPAPVAARGKVFASAPDGSVFAVAGRAPDRW